MFWQKKQNQPGKFGIALEENIKALHEGKLWRIPWVLSVFAENHDESKLAAAKVLSEILETLSFDEIIRVDEQIRSTTSMEWYCDWRKLDIKTFFTPSMNTRERRAVIVFASFNLNGFIREQAVCLMQKYDGTLPYIILRQNDWVTQVRQAAAEVFSYRLQRVSDGELFSALPFIAKLMRGGRVNHREYTERLFAELAAPKHRAALLKGLESKNSSIRRICINVLFDIHPPKFELVFEQLNHESDPFLRSMIFRKLNTFGQNLHKVSIAFLQDPYPANRLLAFHYLIDTGANNILAIAESLLLDKNSRVRNSAERVIQTHIPNFDFRRFYLNNFDDYSAVVISALGEKGESADVSKIADYLKDHRISVVKTAMISLMKLDTKTYSPVITEMLEDSRVGIVKTAMHLVIKTNCPDYERIRELFNNTIYEHTKLKCMDILFTASKWSSLTYMLSAVSIDTERIRKKSLEAINQWLCNFNRSYTVPSEKQVTDIREWIHSLQGVLPAKVETELLYMLS
ncbi:MAG: HEAT repeat domain-containing protein [Spirochaetaceae bacterium]|nr:HEAT repeat domain-containing protein [Spirochaetaceae bacterium]